MYYYYLFISYLFIYLPLYHLLYHSLEVFKELRRYGVKYKHTQTDKTVILYLDFAGIEYKAHL